MSKSLSIKEIKENQENILTDMTSSLVTIKYLPPEQIKNNLDLMLHQTKIQNEDIICDSIAELSKVIIKIHSKYPEKGKKILKFLDTNIQDFINKIELLNKKIEEYYLSPEVYLQGCKTQLISICYSLKQLDKNTNFETLRKSLEVQFKLFNDEYEKAIKVVDMMEKKCKKYSYQSFRNGLDNSFFILKGLWSMKYYLWFLARILYSVNKLVIIPGDLELSFAGILRIAAAVCIAFATDPILLARGQRMIIDFFGMIAFKIFTMPLNMFVNMKKFFNNRFFDILYYVSHYYILSSTTFLQGILRYICIIITNTYTLINSGILINEVIDEIKKTADALFQSGLNGLMVLGNFLINLPSASYNFILNQFAGTQGIIESVWQNISCFLGTKILGLSTCGENIENKTEIIIETENIGKRMRATLQSGKIQLSDRMNIQTAEVNSAIAQKLDAYGHFEKAVNALIPKQEGGGALIIGDIKEFSSTLKDAIKVLPVEQSGQVLATMVKIADEKDGPIIVQGVVDAAREAVKEKIEEEIKNIQDKFLKVFDILDTEKIDIETDGVSYQKLLKTLKFSELDKEARLIGANNSVTSEYLVSFIYIITVISLLFSFFKPLFG
jgi:hypothetical protein